MKTFLFLYPIPEYINWETRTWAPNFIENKGQTIEEMAAEFAETYKEKINACIDERYRKKGFQICFSLFKNHPISPRIHVFPKDRIIYADIDFKTHTTKKPNGKYSYPSPDFTLDQLKDPNPLIVAGFHMWDCVEKVAKRAYKRGLDVMVDEDLTEFFCGLLNDRKDKFDISKFPNYNTIELEKKYFKMFMKARRGKPWLFQDYARPV